MSQFNTIKELVSLEGVARDHGIEFNRNNKSICPFHDEKTPSLHNFVTHCYCFGCGKSADAIDIEAHFTGLSPFEAALLLAERYGIQLPKYSSKDREKFDKQAEAHKLLERLAKHGNKKIKNHPEVLEFLKNKGLDEEDIDRFQIGYVGDENPITNNLKDEKKIELAKEIGLIHDHCDHFRNRIIIPIWSYGKIVFLTGRAYPEGEPKYLHLKNSWLVHKEIAFAENLRKEKCVIVESVTDAIAFIKVGIPACALMGTNPGERDKEQLSNTKAKLYFCLDNDEAGGKAAYKLARELKGFVINLGHDKDPDEVLAVIGGDRFKEITETAISNAKYYLNLVVDRQSIREALIEISKLEYESDKDIWLAKLSEKHEVRVTSLRKDLVTITAEEGLKRVDEKTNNGNDQNQLPEYTKDEITKANEILESQNILDRVIAITNRAGYVKEERNKKLAYLACTSRKLPGKKKAISLITKGESSSGKSELVRTILKLIPPKDVKEFTFITEKALVHTKQDLSHKILCVFEREGGEKSDYTLRTAISEEKLSIFIPVKDAITGDFESIEKEIPAEGMVYIETTTEENTEPQNASRTFEFFTDSSPELTREVLRSQARTHIQNESKLESEYRVWRCLQDLLKPLPVYVPYAEELAEQFPTDKVRARRDYPRLLALIEASAFLHQRNRDREDIDGETYIVANEQDFDIAYNIIRPILSQTYKELSPKEEVLIGILKDEYGIGYFSEPDSPDSSDSNTFSLKNLREKINDRLRDKDTYKTARNFKAYSTLRKYLRKLVSKDIIEWNGQQGIKSKYVLISDIPQISFYISLGSVANTHENESKLNDLKGLEQKTLATEGYDSSMANGLMSEGSDGDEPISHTLATVERSPSFPYKSLQKLPISPLATGNIKERIQKVTYATGEYVFKIEMPDENGKPIINIITPDCTEFEEVKNLYENVNQNIKS